MKWGYLLLCLAFLGCGGPESEEAAQAVNGPKPAAQSACKCGAGLYCNCAGRNCQLCYRTCDPWGGETVGPCQECSYCTVNACGQADTCWN